MMSMYDTCKAGKVSFDDLLHSPVPLPVLIHGFLALWQMRIARDIQLYPHAFQMRSQYWTSMMKMSIHGFEFLEGDYNAFEFIDKIRVSVLSTEEYENDLEFFRFGLEEEVIISHWSGALDLYRISRDLRDVGKAVVSVLGCFRSMKSPDRTVIVDVLSRALASFGGEINGTVYEGIVEKAFKIVCDHLDEWLSAQQKLVTLIHNRFLFLELEESLKEDAFETLEAVLFD